MQRRSPVVRERLERQIYKNTNVSCEHQLLQRTAMKGSPNESFSSSITSTYRRNESISRFYCSTEDLIEQRAVRHENGTLIDCMNAKLGYRYPTAHNTCETTERTIKHHSQSPPHPPSGVVVTQVLAFVSHVTTNPGVISCT